MKNYEEMSNDVFRRINEYNEKKRKRNKMITRTLVPALSFCLIASIGIGGGLDGMFSKAPDQSAMDATIPGIKDWYGPNESDPYASVDGTQSDYEEQDPIDFNSVIWGEQTKREISDVNNGFKNRGGKMASYDLIEAMNSAKPNDVFAVSIGNTQINSFVYNGTTLNQCENERSVLSLYRKKLALLLEEGPVLKYGEALYTTGTPTGEKWAETAYKSRIDFFGKDLLSRFIINGEFYADEVRREIAACDNGDAQKACTEKYEKFRLAYREQVLDKTVNELRKKKINYQYASDNLSVIIFVTVEQFDNLTLAQTDNLLFTLAAKNGKIITAVNTGNTLK